MTGQQPDPEHQGTPDPEVDGWRFASPPCLLHELDPDGTGLPAPDPRSWPEVRRWRKAMRERLIAARQALPAAIRREHSGSIAARLDRLVGEARGRVVAIYWPFRGEPDLRDWGEALRGRGARIALPVVVTPAAPLEFRAWRAGDPLASGVWGIPVPSRGEVVVPDLVVAPLVGFDRGCFRLGHGGGYYDRTLAALHRRPRVLGVGHSLGAIRSIHPQPHDVPMDVIVTERGAVQRDPETTI